MWNLSLTCFESDCIFLLLSQSFGLHLSCSASWHLFRALVYDHTSNHFAPIFTLFLSLSVSLCHFFWLIFNSCTIHETLHVTCYFIAILPFIWLSSFSNHSFSFHSYLYPSSSSSSWFCLFIKFSFFQLYLNLVFVIIFFLLKFQFIVDHLLIL